MSRTSIPLRGNLRWLAPGLTVLAFCTSPGSASHQRQSSDAEPSERVMLRQVDQAQQRMASRLTLWERPVAWTAARDIAGPNYTIRTTRSSLYARRIDELLEANLLTFAALFEVDPTPPEPVTLLLAPDIATYNQLGSDGDEVSSRWGGWYSSSQGAILSYYLPERWTHLWVLHGATQELLLRCGLTGGPTWLQHAIPSFMEVQPGTHYSGGAIQFDQLRGERWTPLPTLLQSPQGWGQDQLRQAGMLLEYLAHHHPRTRRQDDGGWPFADYLRRALSGADPTGNRVPELLGPGLADLDSALRAFQFPKQRSP